LTLLTVLLATFNGAPTLPVVLEAYRTLEAPDGGWKLVIVDNGSTDDTSSVLNRFRPLLPLTCLHVPEPGKNRALNVGLASREGDLVVLTDDDAVPAVDWLVTLRRAADRKKEFAMFGGAIVARWERAPEPWILNWVQHDMTYTLTPTNAKEGVIPATQVGGPNMAVRASLFEMGHRFDEGIGPKAGFAYAMGSETEFTIRMDHLGHRAWFAPDAVVEHIVREFQMERAWILSRASRYGRGLYRLDRQRGEPLPRTIFGMPRWQIRRILMGTVSLIGAKLTGNEERAFQDSWTLHFDWGYLKEARAATRAPFQ
jgi:GT2 family glycosyltransferase